MIVFVAVVGPSNNPLYLQSVGSAAETEDTTHLHYIVHCALDVVDERLRPSYASNPSASSASAPSSLDGTRGAPTSDPYLGMLYPTEDYRVYGYVTNTNVKFMLVLEDTANPKLADLRETFRRLRLAYVDAISNPFHIQGSALESPTFAARVRAILSTS
mmetsp:Transcript_10583/g.20079  ORF Transcript_10583/g.20079 Transcript_10583/m.20079 type:complete len:159 (+) Transcript_10583:96-572(+)|eukprot:CAMPEP_0114253642 /NCGR_PEP_ID=MMETSP0058-20121206/16505_1 /TAXON_ID=36894 /ORGANISM="Pyramimonas parkeae, CCMP726" /LENGTH=158 /DNA_ID=CAMNT_0001367709 /DNA_START=79 /DNA_END=555 /DNA_ORIENTATION=+